MARPAKKNPSSAKAKPAKKAAKKAMAKTKKTTTKKPEVMKPVAKKNVVLKTAAVAKTVKPTKKPGILEVGDVVPAFSMPATFAGQVSNASLKGKSYILYFYPKDDTSGCTAEACEFRNTLPGFTTLGVTVIGVSKDSMESHQKFSRKYNLTFPLASDETGDACEAFGVWTQKNMYGRMYMGIERSTFLIDSKGVVRAVWRKVSVPGHVEDVKKAVAQL